MPSALHHPPVITIFIGGMAYGMITIPTWVVHDCFTHVTHYRGPTLHPWSRIFSRWSLHFANFFLHSSMPCEASCGDARPNAPAMRSEVFNHPELSLTTKECALNHEILEFNRDIQPTWSSTLDQGFVWVVLAIGGRDFPSKDIYNVGPPVVSCFKNPVHYKPYLLDLIGVVFTNLAILNRSATL